MDIVKATEELKAKYPDIGIKSIEMDSTKGTSTFYIEPTKKSLAFLQNPGIPVQFREKASTISRDAITRTGLDLIKPKDAYDETPQDSYKRAIRYYFTDPIVGSATNLLASMSAKGFELDIDDPNIKNFFETWLFDVNFEELLEWVYLDFFKVGHVTTYKVIAAYEPRVSTLSPAPGQKTKKVANKETAAKKNIWSKGHLPVAYTVLNPLLVTVDGNLLFDKTSVKLNPPPELTALLKKSGSELTEDEKNLIKALPSDLKAAAEKGGAYPLDSRLVGTITYRKQPYERYGRPRISKIFDDIEYKRSLRQADLSTLDGISNYILKITIGSDEYPVTTQAELEAVSQLFNTPSKSFDVVWNHTLNVEKIVSPEIEAILGKAKYEQVNEDITGGLAVPRALIDGVGGINAAEVSLVIKGLSEEINYARRQVTKWIYKEFQLIAEAMAFDRFPKVRWDDGVLKDTILYMTTIGSLVDRRMMSYRTALETLNFDYENELQNMTEEQPLVEAGTFGILGSPWQKPAAGAGGTAPSAPKGTPSSRPKGKVPKPKTTKPKPSTQIKQSVKNPKTAQSSLEIEQLVASMSDEEYEQFLEIIEGAREE